MIVEQLEEPSNKRLYYEMRASYHSGTVVDEKLGEKDIVYLASLEKDSFDTVYLMLIYQPINMLLVFLK